MIPCKTAPNFVQTSWEVQNRSASQEKQKPYKPKPYEPIQYPGQRVQNDVKVIPRCCIADPQLKRYHYTAIDEYSRYRILGAYEEQSAFSSADFLSKVVKHFARKGIPIKCAPNNHGFTFTNCFPGSQRGLETCIKAGSKNCEFDTSSFAPIRSGTMERWNAVHEDQNASANVAFLFSAPCVLFAWGFSR